MNKKEYSTNAREKNFDHTKISLVKVVEQEHIQCESFFFYQAQETVSKHYKERAFCKAPSMSMDGGFIKVRFCPWQRSLFLPPAKYQGKKASANREASQTQQACDWLM